MGQRFGRGTRVHELIDLLEHQVKERLLSWWGDSRGMLDSVWAWHQDDRVCAPITGFKHSQVTFQPPKVRRQGGAGRAVRGRRNHTANLEDRDFNTLSVSS